MLLLGDGGFPTKHRQSGGKSQFIVSGKKERKETKISNEKHLARDIFSFFFMFSCKTSSSYTVPGSGLCSL